MGLSRRAKWLDIAVQQEILHRSKKDNLMAFYSIRHPETNGSLLARIGAAIAHERNIVRTGLARRRVYKSTFCELSALNGRELADIGIDRSDIHRLAMEEAMKIHA